MASDILQKEVAGLSEADIGLLIDFARYLKYRMNNTAPKSRAASGPKKRKIGFISDAFVSISSDFDDTPECMRDYV